jgi:hypothetical protein
MRKIGEKIKILTSHIKKINELFCTLTMKTEFIERRKEQRRRRISFTKFNYFLKNFLLFKYFQRR